MMEQVWIAITTLSAIGISMRTRVKAVATISLMTANKLERGTMMLILHSQESGSMMMALKKEPGGLRLVLHSHLLSIIKNKNIGMLQNTTNVAITMTC